MNNIPMAERLRELHRLTIAPHTDPEQRYADYLASGCRMLGLAIGIVGEVRGDTYEILSVRSPLSLNTGMCFALRDTPCAAVIETLGTVSYHRGDSDPISPIHALYANRPLEAYVAAPLRVNDTIFGTLSFADIAPRRQPFSAEDLELVELMALTLSSVIERERMGRQRRHTEEELRHNMALFESAFHHAAIGMALVGLDGRWIKVNAALLDILGYTEAELLAVDFQRITHPEDLETDLHLLQQTLRGERNTYLMEKRYLHRAGHIVHVLLSVSLVHNADGTPRYFISQLQDISARRDAEQALAERSRELEHLNSRLQELAVTDGLTGIANHRHFIERLLQELDRSTRFAQPLSVILADIDYFKEVNDTFGHQVGDEVLKACAQALSETLRSVDLVARYGGEEFAILLPATDADSAAAIAERLRLAAATVQLPQGHITASFGLVTRVPSPRSNEDISLKALIGMADAALYQAKRSGRNRVVATQS